MSLSDTLKKAAGLFVEIPPSQPVMIRPRVSPQTSTPGPAAAHAPEEDDLDRRLAEMDKTIGRMGAASGLSQPASPPPLTAPVSKTVDQIVRDSHGPNLDEIDVPSGMAAGALRPDGTLDYAALYAAASLPQTPFTAEQTIDMLASLPESLPLEMKRQTVQVTLASIGKTIGATPETIVADTSRKLAALASYSDGFGRHTGEFVAKSEAEIAALLAKVEGLRTEILAAQKQQASIQSLCGSESARLHDVLEFFSLDVPPSRHAGDGSGAGAA